MRIELTAKEVERICDSVTREMVKVEVTRQVAEKMGAYIRETRKISLTTTKAQDAMDTLLHLIGETEAKMQGIGEHVAKQTTEQIHAEVKVKLARVIDAVESEMRNKLDAIQKALTRISMAGPLSKTVIEHPENVP